jgi:RNA polymerase sigma-70 factor (ECF subfamily)
MKIGMADEKVLVGQLVAGDRTAFECVYRKHNASMIRVCQGVVRNRATAEEVVQDTWVAVLKGVAAFEGRSSLAGWIYAILVNKARSRAVRDGRTVSFDGEGEDDSLAAAFDGRGRWKDMPELWETVTADRIVEGRNMMAHVTAAIETLPPAQRAVLILRGQQELEPAEVCAALGITEGNMRVLLHRARLSVRKALDGLLAEKALS